MMRNETKRKEMRLLIKAYAEPRLLCVLLSVLADAFKFSGPNLRLFVELGWMMLACVDCSFIVEMEISKYAHLIIMSIGT